MKAFKIETPPYGTKLLALFGKPSEARKRLKNEISKKNLKRWDFKGCDGLTIMYGALAVMWVRELPKTPRLKNVLQHELVHVVNDILSYVGVERTGSDEGGAYLTGWITEQIYKKLK